MINAWRHTLFGDGHGIGRPGQVNPKCGAAQEAQAAAQTDKLRGAGTVCHSLVNTQSCGATQGNARVAGQVNVQRRRLCNYLECFAGMGRHC